MKTNKNFYKNDNEEYKSYLAERKKYALFCNTNYEIIKILKEKGEFDEKTYKPIRGYTNPNKSKIYPIYQMIWSQTRCKQEFFTAFLWINIILILLFFWWNIITILLSVGILLSVAAFIFIKNKKKILMWIYNERYRNELKDLKEKEREKGLLNRKERKQFNTLVIFGIILILLITLITLYANGGLF